MYVADGAGRAKGKKVNRFAGRVDLRHPRWTHGGMRLEGFRVVAKPQR